MVRQAFLKEISDTLSKSEYFEEQDFKLVWKEANRGYDLQISYRYDDAYGLSGHVGEEIEDGAREIGIQGTARPGDIGLSENFKVYGRAKFLAYVTQWAGRLRSELQAIPVNRAIEDQRKQIEELLGKFAKLPNEYFSREEAESLKSRLDALEQQMIESIVSNAAEEEDVSARVTSLEQDFTVLKETLGNLKKPGWARAFATRVARWMHDSDNRKLLADGVDITRRLLGP
jgi:hypothetical protein